MMNWMKKATLAVGATVLLSASANAALTPKFLLSAPSINNAGKTTFTYELILSSTGRLDDSIRPNTSHFFVLFDFAGFVAGSQVSSNPDFAPIVPSNVGPNNGTGAPVNPDNPGIVNIGWEWIGTGSFGGGGSEFSLGIFEVDSDFAVEALDSYQSQDTKDNPGELEDGTIGFSESSSVVPTSGIPEPATMVLLGSSLLGLAAVRSKLVRK